MPDQAAIVQELLNRPDLPPDKLPIVQELARRFGLQWVPDAGAQMRASALRGVEAQMRQGDTIPVPLDPMFAGPVERIDPTSPETPALATAVLPQAGLERVGAGLEQMSRPGLRAKAGGASNIIRGAMQAAAPVALPAGFVAAPAATIAGLAGGSLAQAATEAGLESLDVPEEYRNLAGDIAGFAGGGAAAKLTPAAARAAFTAAREARLLPRSGTPVQRAAVDWALSQGAPLDAAAATLNPAVRGLQEVARTTFGAGHSAEAAIEAQKAWYARKGQQLAAQTGGADLSPETAGRAVADASTAAIRGANQTATDAYAALKTREADPATHVRVATGSKKVTTNLVDAEGNAVTHQVPTYEDVPIPVDMAPYQERFRPLVAELRRSVQYGQQQFAPALKAVEDLVDGPRFQPASVAERNLSALKDVSRNGTLAAGVKTEAGGLAAASIPELQSAIDSAVLKHAGRDGLAELKTGRAQTAEKYAVLDLVDQYRNEPVKLFQQLTQPRDAGIDFLRSVQKVAPEQMPGLGRAWLNQELTFAGDEGGFGHNDAIFNHWRDLGPQTKQLFFKNPQLVSDLDRFFQAQKDSAKTFNKSVTTPAAHMAQQGLEITYAGANLLMGNPIPAALAATHTIAGNVLSRLLYNPRFVRAAIRAFNAPASSPAGAAAASQLIAAAGSAAQLNRAGSTATGEGAALSGAARGSAGTGAAAAGGDATAAGASATRIPIPGESGAGYAAEYKLRELGDIQASHNGATFQPNPKYALKNDRDYGNAVNQGKIVAGASQAEFNPSLHVTDNPDATNGPLVVDSAGNVLGGNGRKMILDRVYTSNPKGAAAYKALLQQKAAQFGVDPAAIAGMKRPVLVREIPDAELAGAGGKQAAVTNLNKVGTASLTPGERAIADSRRVSPATLEDVAGRLDQKGANATLADVLQGKPGGEVLNKLISDGVVTPQERAAFMTSDGELTPAGKDRIQKLILGRFFEDPAQLDSIAPSVRNNVERIAAPLAQVEAKGGEWNLTPDVQSALGILERAQKLKIRNVDDYLRQEGLFGAQNYTPRAIALAKALQSMGAEEIKAAARQYAQDAGFAAGGESLFGSAPTPDSSFVDAFERAPVPVTKNALSKPTKAKNSLTRK